MDRQNMRHIGLAIAMLMICMGSHARTYTVKGNKGADIQETIDLAAKEGGGKVVVPEGIYNVASIFLQSNINLHLDKGAVLVGSKNSDDYDSFPQNICRINPEHSSKVFVYAYNSKNISITGEGIIEGQGPSFFDTNPNWAGYYSKPPVERPLMVKFVHCQNIRFEGITLKDSPCWTMMLRLCKNIVVEGITITADQKMINNDGIDVDGCSHVRIRNSRFKTCDDCIVLRAIRETPDQDIVCENVRVRNCNLNSACQTVRLGCPSDGTIRNAIFKDIQAEGNNGIYAEFPVRYLTQGDTGDVSISDITFKNYSGKFSGSALQIVSEPGVTSRKIDGFKFENLDVKSRRPLRFIGNEGYEIGSVLVKDFEAEVEDDTPYIVAGCKDLDFKNVIINGKSIPDGKVASEKGSSQAIKLVKSESWERTK